MDHGHHGGRQPSSGQAPSDRDGGFRTKIVFAVLLAIAAFFLLTEHRAHVFGYLPFLLLLACPLLHMFHHGGHGGHGGRSAGTGNEPPSRDAQRAPREGN